MGNEKKLTLEDISKLTCIIRKAFYFFGFENKREEASKEMRELAKVLRSEYKIPYPEELNIAPETELTPEVMQAFEKLERWVAINLAITKYWENGISRYGIKGLAFKE